jgi:hypothetical protein
MDIQRIELHCSLLECSLCDAAVRGDWVRLLGSRLLCVSLVGLGEARSSACQCLHVCLKEPCNRQQCEVPSWAR